MSRRAPGEGAAPLRARSPSAAQPGRFVSKRAASRSSPRRPAPIPTSTMARNNLAENACHAAPSTPSNAPQSVKCSRMQSVLMASSISRGRRRPSGRPPTTGSPQAVCRHERQAAWPLPGPFAHTATPSSLHHACAVHLDSEAKGTTPSEWSGAVNLCRCSRRRLPSRPHERRCGRS